MRFVQWPAPICYLLSPIRWVCYCWCRWSWQMMLNHSRGSWPIPIVANVKYPSGIPCLPRKRYSSVDFNNNEKKWSKPKIRKIRSFKNNIQLWAQHVRLMDHGSSTQFESNKKDVAKFYENRLKMRKKSNDFHMQQQMRKRKKKYANRNQNSLC